MKARKLFSALTLVLILISQTWPAAWATSDRPLVEPAVSDPKPSTRLSFALSNTLPTPAPVADTSMQPPEPTPPADAPAGERDAPQELQDMPGVTQDWWHTVQEQIQQEMYAFSNVEQNEIPSFTGYNPSNDFDINFSSGTVRLTPTHPASDRDRAPSANKPAPWTWELEFSGYGYQDHVQPIAAPTEMTVSDNHVTYQRTAANQQITEWYINDERGLEQGFTIAAPPEGNHEGVPLQIEMTLNTTLTSTLSADRQSINFFTAMDDGPSVPVLRYTDLYVFDADGRELPAHLQLKSDTPFPNDTLAIIIDDSNAAYPITIDPLVINLGYWLEIGKDEEELGFVSTAGDVNGDGFDDFIIGAQYRRRAYLFYGSYDFSLTAYTFITLSVDAHRFGQAVGTAGDVNGDGYADVFVGAPGSNDKVYIWYGSEDGLCHGRSTCDEADVEFDQPTVTQGTITNECTKYVGTAGDVNADGFDDFIIGSDQIDTMGEDAGQVDVFYGSENGLSTTPDWTISGERGDDHFGWAAGTAGDVNGDGYDDVIVGAPERDSEADTDDIDYGKAYVYLGSADGLGTVAAWTAAGQEEDDHFGFDVGTAGDVNGDGYADIIVGAPRDPDSGARTGKTYVYYGSAEGLVTSGFRADWEASGEKNDDHFGWSVGTAGDLNGDGYDDVIIGAPQHDGVPGKEGAENDAGEAYVYYGSADGLKLSAGWERSGLAGGNECGYTAGTAGDVNGDGYSDYLVGVPFYDGYNGITYLYFGEPPPSNDLADWSIKGANVDERLGWSVNAAGDVNSDGYGDVVVGAYGYENDTGRVAVYPGSPTGLLTTTLWTAGGETLGDEFGWSVGSAGDVNGDGHDDVIIGAPGHDGDRGRVYVYVYTKTMSGWGAAPLWIAAGESHNDRFGDAVGTAGDVNNDGYDDIVIGAVGYPLGNGYGKAYVYHGAAEGLRSTHAWSAAGASTGNKFGAAVGTAGDVNADGFGDVIIGAPGHDDDTGQVAVYYGSEDGLATGPPDWEDVGEYDGDLFGWSVSTAGDVDGDGKSDIIIGVPGDGRASVYYGTQAGLRDTPAWTIELAERRKFGWAVGTAGDVDGDGDAEIVVGAPNSDSAQGIVYLYEGSESRSSDLLRKWYGDGAGDQFGFAVATGDVNGDGYGDVIVGAPGYDAGNANVGQVSVYHGKPSGLSAGGDTWKASEHGYAVATAGDVDNDGYADVIVGAQTADGKGHVAVYHGAADGLSNEPVFNAEGKADSYFGRVVGTAGDVNYDGYDDVVIGAPGENKVYVYYGSATGLSDKADWSVGAEAKNMNRSYVGTAGDVNGDTYDDLIVGADGYGAGEIGRIYVYYGSPSGLISTPAFTVTGETDGDMFGAAVGAASDLNDDNYDDVIVSAPGYGTDEGKIYVYFGGTRGLTETKKWTEIGQHDNVCLGRSVGAAGDVNGDSYNDVVVSAGCGGDGDESQLYVYHWDEATENLSGDASWDDPSDEPSFGEIVGAAGDVNGDGYDDVVVSAPGYDNDRGQVYVYYGSAKGLGDADWIATGDWSSGFGFVAGTAGDVDGDGYADLIVGAAKVNGSTIESTGAARVYYGSLIGLSTSVTGKAKNDELGHAVGTAGDVNGDGYSDIVVNAQNETTVYYGGAAGLSPWIVSGSYSDVGAAGDVNGDGYGDLVLGAYDYDSYRGQVHVYHGSDAGLSITPAFTITGENTGDEFGNAVGAAGDVNGDGYGDLVVGAPECNATSGQQTLQDAGQLYVYYGSDKGLSVTPALTITGENAGDEFGTAVGTAGDVNGDGYSDVIVGAHRYDDSSGKDILYDTGKVYVYYGNDTGLGATPAFTIVGENKDDKFGAAAGAAGDVNGDGYSDVIVGAYDYDDVSSSKTLTNTGKVYVYHGSVTGLDAPFFEQTGEKSNDKFGLAVGTAGDVNGDGYADIVVGAYRYDTAVYTDIVIIPGWITITGEYGDFTIDTGKVYVYPGSSTGISADAIFTAVGENEYDRFGVAVGTAGDVDGDGYSDVIVGAYSYDAPALAGADPLTNTGRVYVYRGNGGGGQAAVARQLRGSSDVPVQPWGATWTVDAFRVSMLSADPLGRGKARLQVQACPVGVPFNTPACLDYVAPNITTIIDDITLDETITGATPGSLYRWRARAVYDSPLIPYGPWRRFQAQALEADLRVMTPPGDLEIVKTIQPDQAVSIGDPITFTLRFSNTFGGPAAGVIINDVISADDLTNISISSQGAAITDTSTPPTYTWQVQDLNSGEGGVITITGMAADRQFVNVAVITATRTKDRNAENNVAYAQTVVAGVIYVDADARGANDGTSWFNAYTDLQDALEEAGPQNQVWVAEGEYVPTSTPSDRQATFALKCGVKLYGGFMGREAHLYDRDWMAHPVILSGDIGDLGDAKDNVYHVVTASGATGTVLLCTNDALLDGFIVSGGMADAVHDNGQGGGMRCNEANPTLRHVSFVGNSAHYGGGLYTVNSEPALFNVAFSGNHALLDADDDGGHGGGLFNDTGSHPQLLNVTFSHNTATNAGGGIYADRDSDLTLTNGVLWGNTAAITGAQVSQASTGVSTVTITYSDIQDAISEWRVANLHNIDANPMFYDANGPDDVWGTLDDDLRLRYTSPVIDAGNGGVLPKDPQDLDGDGVTTETHPFDVTSRHRIVDAPNANATSPPVDMGAYEFTVLDVLDEAKVFLNEGVAFRMQNLQLLPADTLENALQNYANFNDGEMFYAFCSDYDEISENQYCPPDENGPPRDDVYQPNIRNKLVYAVELYHYARNWPTANFVTVRRVTVPIHEPAERGMLQAAKEVANDHLIFGQEFLVDATDYRFSTNLTYADLIIESEIDDLKLAEQQFRATMAFLLYAYTDMDIGKYLSNTELETFGNAAKYLQQAMSERASRLWQMGDREQARAVYNNGEQEINLELITFAKVVAVQAATTALSSTEPVTITYLTNGSWEMLTALSQMRDRAEAIEAGLDFFGFAANYAPRQPYDALLYLTAKGASGYDGLIATARDLEDQAREYQRMFDKNASDMAAELDNLSRELDEQLFDLCGESTDEDSDGFGDYDGDCAGGLMRQNLAALISAQLNVELALKKQQNIKEQVLIEQKRANEVINIDLGLGYAIKAAELAIGMLEAQKTVIAHSDSGELSVYAGVEGRAGQYFGALRQDATGWMPQAGGSVEIIGTAGYGYSHIDSSETTWDPNAEEIGEWESKKALKEAIAAAEIVGAESEAKIRNLFLQLSEAGIEYDIAIEEFNRVAAEHNHLAEKFVRLLNQREQAINRVATHNSHLLNPAYRIWRDSTTVMSTDAINLTAQYAYLTARAAEYEMLTPYPALGDILKARTTNDIRLFLNDLEIWYLAVNAPGALNRYPYTFSLRDDLLLTERDGTTGNRLLDYKECVTKTITTTLPIANTVDVLECTFATELYAEGAYGEPMFSPNIWGNRIAGIGTPLANSAGVSADLVTSQPTQDIGPVELVLIHDGTTTFRRAGGETVIYDMGPAVPVGYPVPDEFNPDDTTVVLRPSINGEGEAISNAGLVNLSVTASSWTIRIRADSDGHLDWDQLQDIVLTLDTTGRSLPNRKQQATRDAVRLQAGQRMDVQPMLVQHAAPLRSAADAEAPPEQDLMPSASYGQLGGSYFGNVLVTDPVSAALHSLDLNLVYHSNALSGTITGTVRVEKTALYSGDIPLKGTVTGDRFTLSSGVITNVLSGKSVQQMFTLDGYGDLGGNIIVADYTAVITGLLPTPYTTRGGYNGIRPIVTGSDMFWLQATTLSVPLGGATTLTANLFDHVGVPLDDTVTLTLVGEGTVSPSTVDTGDDGQAPITFKASETEKLVTIIATTTSGLTDMVSIDVRGAYAYRVYLPLVLK